VGKHFAEIRFNIKYSAKIRPHDLIIGRESVKTSLIISRLFRGWLHALSPHFRQFDLAMGDLNLQISQPKLGHV
jgi:hypothetical protein